MTAAWPHIATTTTEPVLRRAAGHREEHFLARLVDRLPPLREPVGDAYLDVLDHALIDRHISACEADALVAAADTLGLARVDVHSLHRTYLTQLAAAALDDGILTTAERRDLNTVAELLGLQTSDVDHALTAATNPPAANSDEVSDAAGDEAHNTTGDHPAGRPQWRLEPGDTIVLTGAMNPPREQWHAATIAAGLRVGDNVTKTTRLLVAADPDSMSGKAKKARQYRIPIIHPTAYQNILRNRRVGSIGM